LGLHKYFSINQVKQYLTVTFENPLRLVARNMQHSIHDKKKLQHGPFIVCLCVIYVSRCKYHLIAFSKLQANQQYLVI